MSTLAALFGVLGGLAVLYRPLCARLGRSTAMCTLFLLLFTTFLLDLVVRGLPGPAMAFLFASAAVALSEKRRLPILPRALGTGLLAGMASGLQWTSAGLLLLVPTSEEPYGPQRIAQRCLTALTGFTLGWAPWWVMAASPSLHLGVPDPMPALFGSRQGVLYLTPALWLGLLGLAVALLRPAERARPWALATGGLLLLHAACRTAEEGPCPRETLAALLAVLAPGFGLALRGMVACVRARPQLALSAGAALAVAWNLLFMQQYASGMIPRDFPLSFTVVAENSARLLARSVGTPLAWPANWLFARRHRLGVDRYDLAAGKRLPVTGERAVVVDVGALETDEALLAEGWSVRHHCGEQVCRAVEGRARLLLPLSAAAAQVELRVSASGSGTLSAALGAHQGEARHLGPQPAELLFVLRDARRGLNEIVLATSPGGQALVDRLTLRALR